MLNLGDSPERDALSIGNQVSMEVVVSGAGPLSDWEARVASRFRAGAAWESGKLTRNKLDF
jgi:hypothetical protein